MSDTLHIASITFNDIKRAYAGQHLPGKLENVNTCIGSMSFYRRRDSKMTDSYTYAVYAKGQHVGDVT